MGFLLYALNPTKDPILKSESRPDRPKAEDDQDPSKMTRNLAASKSIASDEHKEISPKSFSNSGEGFVLEPELSREEQRKWNIFLEILSLQNDNDPRLDKDLGEMSQALHQNLYRKYESLALESRNQRGLITFLIARDLKDSRDLEFLKKVYEEGPCLSLENCGANAASDPHLSGVDQSSMNYPQLAALYQLERQIKTHSELLETSDMKDRAQAVIEQALRFPVLIVQKKAAEVDSLLRERL